MLSTHPVIAGGDVCMKLITNYKSPIGCWTDQRGIPTVIYVENDKLWSAEGENAEIESPLSVTRVDNEVRIKNEGPAYKLAITYFIINTEGDLELRDTDGDLNKTYKKHTNINVNLLNSLLSH